MKLLYGTGNEGKILVMRRALQPLEKIELIGLKDLGRPAPQVEETGTALLENARIKAKAYYEAFRMPVFSCDTGLIFQGVSEEYQPGIHVRRPLGYEMTDEEMMAYYSGLVQKFGSLHARYRNAVCFYLDEDHVYESQEDALSGVPFLLTGVPHEKYQPGFPLDRYSLQISSGKYYYDLPGQAQDEVALEKGFLEFFRNIIGETEGKVHIQMKDYMIK